MDKKALILHAWYSNPSDNWYQWLKKQLEKKGYEVYIPDLPTMGTNLPDMKKQLAFVEKNFKFDKDTIVFGHSLGTLLAMRLAEKFQFKKMFLVAGWDFNDLTAEHRLFWPNPINHKKIKRNVKEILVISSDNDPYITAVTAEDMSKRLGGKFILQKGKCHFSKKAWKCDQTTGGFEVYLNSIMLDPKKLSKIGIGGWGLGGFAERDPKNDDAKQINALVHSLKKGMNFIEINFWNSQGKSVELLSEAIKRSKVKRENLFYSLVIYNYFLPTLKDAKKEIDKYFQLFETDYVDSLEFTMPNFKIYGFTESCKFVSDYLSKSRARYTSLTNCNLEMLKKYHKVFKDKLFSHEFHFSYEIRDNEGLGISSYASDNNILNFIYQPLRRNRTMKRNWPLLLELSEKYGKTQNQIILNWMNWKGFKPLIKSETIEHINENLNSFDFQMGEMDYKKIDGFRIPNYKKPNIDWWQEGKFGEKIHTLPNVIDDILDGKYEYRK